MKTEGSISLLIRGNHFDVKELDCNMSIKGTRVLIEGQKSSNHEMVFNLWEYEYKFNEDNVNEVLNHFLVLIKENINVIEEVKKNNECVFDLFIHSDEAQLGISISSNNLIKFGELGLKLEVSILSNGFVYDEGGIEHNINELFDNK